jgi:hypothetical protein
MIQYSGENWDSPAPYISAGAHATTLEMTDAQKRAARKRKPIGFAPPAEPSKAPAKRKPRTRRPAA